MKMLRATLALIVTGYSASAGMDGLRAMIQDKIQLNVENTELVTIDADLPDCTQGSKLFCPLAQIPNVTFAAEGGTISSSASTCCPKNYLQCQVQQNIPYDRTLGYYTITGSTAPDQDVCPPTSPQCTCQQSLSGQSFLNLRFCPSTAPCCPNCQCYGDPHCKAFSGSGEVWAICDSRDTTCLHNAGTCGTQTYKGLPCVWNPSKSGSPAYCSRPVGSPVPTMIMYRKNYMKYFTPSDKNVYQFTLVLTLSTYGAINRVDLTDTGTSAQTYSWFLDGNNNCQGNSAYPFNPAGYSYISNLQSMVNIQLQCLSGKNRSPVSGRIDVLHLQDPWFTPGVPSDFGGYCATGIIAEAVGEKDPGLCNTVDRQIAMYYGCKATANINTCKANWCSNHYYALDYTNIGSPANTVAQKRQLCTSFVNNPSSSAVKNFMAAVCAIAPSVAGQNLPADPTLCASDPDCKQCMDNLIDYPDEIATILQGAAATPAPTPSGCSGLLEQGLERKVLGSSQSGIEIDVQNPISKVWTPVFALFDEEIAGCDCGLLSVNGSAPAYAALVAPGYYRVFQRVGLNTDPTQDICTSAPGYNTTITYINPITQPVFSTPFGQMFSSNPPQLVCSQDVFPNCPRDNTCCVWQTSQEAWNSCMAGKYGPTWQKMYPYCKFP